MDGSSALAFSCFGLTLSLSRSSDGMNQLPMSHHLIPPNPEYRVPVYPCPALDSVYKPFSSSLLLWVVLPES